MRAHTHANEREREGRKEREMKGGGGGFCEIILAVYKNMSLRMIFSYNNSIVFIKKKISKNICRLEWVRNKKNSRIHEEEGVFHNDFS